ncbi:MAG: hypothetical protein ACRBK7_11030 [Acidimicrobiales bacterium]
MENRIADIQLRLSAISEELTDISVDLLRQAVEAGEGKRPPLDKTLGQARRAVDKAARLLEARDLADSTDWD